MGQGDIGEIVRRHRLEEIVKHKSEYSVEHPKRGIGEVAYVHVVRIGKYLLMFSPDNNRILAYIQNVDGSYERLSGSLIEWIRRHDFIPERLVIEDWKNPAAVTIDVIVGLPEEKELIEQALA